MSNLHHYFLVNIRTSQRIPFFSKFLVLNRNRILWTLHLLHLPASDSGFYKNFSLSTSDRFLWASKALGFRVERKAFVRAPPGMPPRCFIPCDIPEPELTKGIRISGMQKRDYNATKLQANRTDSNLKSWLSWPDMVCIVTCPICLQQKLLHLPNQLYVINDIPFISNI